MDELPGCSHTKCAYLKKKKIRSKLCQTRGTFKESFRNPKKNKQTKKTHLKMESTVRTQNLCLSFEVGECKSTPSHT